jgi:hypothetical protein
MRSDSDNSTLSGDRISGSSSNDDVVPSKTSSGGSNDLDNVSTRNGAMGNGSNRFRKQQLYPHADDKIAGA